MPADDPRTVPAAAGSRTSGPDRSAEDRRSMQDREPPRDAGQPARGSVLGVMVVFAAAGFVMGQALARVPAVRDALGVDKAQLGLALMGMGLGSLLAMPFTGRLVDRFGSRRVVLLAVVVGCAGWGAVALAPSAAVLMGTLVVTGVAVGIWDVAMNIQATHVEQQRGRSWMPYFHAGFSGGAVLGSGTGALLAWLGVGLVQLPVLAVVAAVAGVLGAVRFVRESVGQEQDDPSPAGGERPVRRGVTRLEILIGLVCLAAALAEGSANDWLALLLVDVQGAPEAFGALALTAFNLTMTIGRLVGGPTIDRFGRAVVVRAGGVLAATGILVVTLVPSTSLALVGGLLWGLGVSTIFPAAMSAAGEVPGRGNRAITVVSTIAYGAFLFGAPTIGLLAELVGLDRALFLVVGFLLVMAVLAPVMRDQRVRS
ncbi:MFS transporter [Ornithinimicrobium sp. W1665]|uniref:MFS transporter n=2 Tax=Ornithinimicrobium sp. W1665 TaxID=3416666 RepID=UPI003CF0E7A8